MNQQQLRREIVKLREDIATVERSISISTGVFKQMFEDHLVRVKTQLRILEERDSES